MECASQCVQSFASFFFDRNLPILTSRSKNRSATMHRADSRVERRSVSPAMHDRTCERERNAKDEGPVFFYDGNPKNARSFFHGQDALVLGRKKG